MWVSNISYYSIRKIFYARISYNTPIFVSEFIITLLYASLDFIMNIYRNNYIIVANKGIIVFTLFNNRLTGRAYLGSHPALRDGLTR